MKPLLLLDVDGPLNPFNADPRPDGYDLFYVDTMTGAFLTADDAGKRAKRMVPTLLSKSTGDLLSRLTDHYDVHWASYWEDLAVKHLTSYFGLPADTPYVEMRNTGMAANSVPYFGKVYAKTADIFRHVNDHGRDFVWVDDEAGDAEARALAYAWSESVRRGERDGSPRFLVKTVDSAIGLTAADIDDLIAWAS